MSISSYLFLDGFKYLRSSGYSLETRTDDKCFFSLDKIDELVVRCLARSYRHLTIPSFTD